MNTAKRLAFLVVVLGLLGTGLLITRAHKTAGAACDSVFEPWNARCFPSDECMPPLGKPAGICDAPHTKIEVPETTFVLGPSDWEAEGKVPPRTVHAAAFAIDAFEATDGRVHHATNDAARAASAISRDDADAFCKSQGGRLPTEDEWLAAAAGEKARRYPWGDTGAVCRRAAWGLVSGPCARNADGPDTVGAHSSGDTPTGIHDLAGNVAEWVTTADPAHDVALGGSYASSLATELRTWERIEVAHGTTDRTIGFRCAYDDVRQDEK
ncbi:MAG TPA: SUMF1/EgtB/PvdO family nonheme iron enzyme [Polyangiaceae bacterium]